MTENFELSSYFPFTNIVLPAIINMSSSLDAEPLDFVENSRLLPSPDSFAHGLTWGGTHYRDRIEDQDIELGTISSTPIGVGNQNSQIDGDHFITGPSNPLYSRHTGPTKSAASIFHALSKWIKSAQPSRPFKIKPILPQFQNIPIVFLDKYFPGQQQRFWLLLILSLLWIIVFSAVLSTSIYGCHIPGYNAPIRLSCVSRLW